MMTNQFKNTHVVLSELLESLRKRTDATDDYLLHIKDSEMLNPLLTRGSVRDIGKNEALPPEFFNGFGIRRLILDTLHGRLSLSENNFIDTVNKKAGAFKWHDLKDELLWEDLKMLLGNSRVVEFANWSDVKNASDIWDNLRRDIIRPLNRNDFEFIFYLGDATNRFAFETDEFLDIISDYAVYGRVTLVLDEQRVDYLCAMLYGWDAYDKISSSHTLCEKCRSVFDLINIDHLIIDSFPATLLFSRLQHFELATRENFAGANKAGKYFEAGYILGLLMKIDISQAMALGQAVSGLYTGNGFQPDGKGLISYIERWIGEIESRIEEEHPLSEDRRENHSSLLS